MPRMTNSAFRALQSEFPFYVTEDDRELSEFELLHTICTRQQDDLEAARGLIAQAADALTPPRNSEESEVLQSPHRSVGGPSHTSENWVTV